MPQSRSGWLATVALSISMGTGALHAAAPPQRGLLAEILQQQRHDSEAPARWDARSITRKTWIPLLASQPWKPGVEEELDGAIHSSPIWFPDADLPLHWLGSPHLPLSGNFVDGRREVSVADLLALPVSLLYDDDGSEYCHVRVAPFDVAPYRRAVESLQALGKLRAWRLLIELAACRGGGTRTFSLCRMLFQAKPNGEFRRPSCVWYYFDGHELVVPPLASMEFGEAESATEYVRYCIYECDWKQGKRETKSASE
jgi:hypothetical protein